MIASLAIMFVVGGAFVRQGAATTFDPASPTEKFLPAR